MRTRFAIVTICCALLSSFGGVYLSATRPGLAQTQNICGTGGGVIISYFQTPDYRIRICRYTNGRLFYIGENNASLDWIRLPTTLMGSDFVARNRGTEYRINSNFLTVSQNGRLVLRQRVTYFEGEGTIGNLPPTSGPVVAFQTRGYRVRVDRRNNQLLMTIINKQDGIPFLNGVPAERAPRRGTDDNWVSYVNTRGETRAYVRTNPSGNQEFELVRSDGSRLVEPGY